MLSDSRPFDLAYYLKRRLGKVMLPFVVWSVFYAWLSAGALPDLMPTLQKTYCWQCVPRNLLPPWVFLLFFASLLGDPLFTARDAKR